ncbi:unnamed protein product, partial [Brassica rapa subsp. trilocularis]
MEMTIYDVYGDRLTTTSNTQVYIIDPLNKLYFDFKNIHEIPHIRNMDRNYPIDTMGVVFNTEAHFDDHERPKMVFYIRDNIQIKYVATGHHAYAFRKGFQNMGDRGELSKTFLNSFIHVMLVLLNYGLRSRVNYLTSGTICFCQKLRSSGSLYYEV